MCGFGRTGRWFAFEGYDVVPDLITFAKGVNSGYVPVGGVDHLGRDRRRLRRAGLPRRTHLQRAPAGRGIHRRRARRDGVRGHRRERPPGRRRGDRPRRWQSCRSKHPLIGEVRGEGVFWAVELVDRPRRRASRSRPRVIGQLKKEMVARGLLPFSADNRIHVVPPCVVTDDEVARAMAIYDEALTVVESRLTLLLARVPSFLARVPSFSARVPYPSPKPGPTLERHVPTRLRPTKEDTMTDSATLEQTTPSATTDPRPLGRRGRLERRIHPHRARLQPGARARAARGPPRLDRRRRRRPSPRPPRRGRSGATRRSPSARRCCSTSASC